ncbi:hypothetical protein COO60DRAFT_674448 [Scenedesmus sp. NREL 46B-D3]|nr:hypothetical protein COO60DRAFT_674448 [Scenedesmus sp. NREL 46B-D3]
MHRSGRLGAAAAAAGTPLPRPQFTPHSMPPPASRRSSLQAAVAVTPAGSAAAPGGSSMKRSPFAGVTPVGAELPRLQPMLSGAAAASPSDVNLQSSSDGGLAGDSGDDQGWQETLAGNSSMVSPRDEVQLSLGLEFTTSSSPPAAAAAAATATPGDTATTDAAVARSGAAGAAARGSARLPAKLRCKDAKNAPAAAALTSRPAGVSADHSSDSCREASPAAEPAAHSQYLAALAAAAAAEHEQQQQHNMPACIAGASSSGGRRSISPGVSAQHGTPDMLAGGSNTGRTGYVTPAGRMGLKRLWCHTHAAAMAAAAAAAAAKDCTAAAAAAVDASGHEAGPAACRSRSPDSQAVALSAELLLAAAERRHHRQQQQQGRRMSDQGNSAAAPAAAPQPRNLPDAGTSLMLPPAAQLRLRQQEQRQQQPHQHSAAPGTATCQPSTAGVAAAQPAWTRSSSQTAASSQAGSAHGSCLHAPPCVTHSAGAQGAQQGSPTAAGLQQQVGQLNQQLAAMGYSRYSPYPSSRTSSTAAACSAAAGCASYPADAAQTGQPRTLASGDVRGRMPHVTPALHAVQCGIRTSHAGVLLHSGPPGVQLSQQQQQALTAAAWSNTRLLMQQQQQQGMVVGASAAAAGQHRLARCSATPEPPAMPAAAAAAAKPAAGPAGLPEQQQTQQQQQQQGGRVSGVELLPCIQPLAMPSTLSDDEAWQIALTQPWVIQQEAARAQQLMAQVGVAAAAAGGVYGGGAAPLARRAAGPAQDGSEDAAAGGIKAAGGAMQPPASRRAAAALSLSGAAAAAAGYNCQGVRSSVPAQQQKQQQQLVKDAQQGPSPRTGGALGGVLRSSNIINTL